MPNLSKPAVSKLILLLILIGIIYILYQQKYVFPFLEARTKLKTANLPVYALYSFLRMLAAYILSVIFSLVYGYTAAMNKKAEKIMLPVLDVLQSVPVLGFFPIVIIFLINLFKGSKLGVELAAIVLIFTSQAWNIAFGVYESLTTIPNDLLLAAKAFLLKGRLLFIKLLFPASIPKLVYNSIMSWAGGWYFLIACEIITAGPAYYRLPGLGSFLMEAAETGDWFSLIIGIVTLVSIITLMNIFIWHPLQIFAERFKYEYTAVGVVRPVGRTGLMSIFAPISWLKKIPLPKKAIKFAPNLTIGFMHVTSYIFHLPIKFFQILKKILPKEIVFKILKVMLIFIGIVFLGGLIYFSAKALVYVFTNPFPKEAVSIPLALFFSFIRLLIAYILSLAWTLPLAIYLGRNKKINQILMPVFEIAASIPATALFPVIVMVVIHYTHSMNIASILLILTGMQWYLLFNLTSGVASIPEDLKEAVKSLRVGRWLTYRKLILPSLVPSLITGSITGWGGGWNALIVSEYLVYQNKTYSAFGIGNLLNCATYSGDFSLLLLSLLSMIIVIVSLNHLFWRRLYEFAVNRYRFDL